jgi:diguanylate cyclase (GGDEF)-like protein/PAS domain S-box-containing protein
MTSAGTAGRGAALAAPLAAATAVGVGSYLLIIMAFKLFVPPSVISPLWLPGVAAVVAVMVRSPRSWWVWLVLGYSIGAVAARVGTVGWPLTLTQGIVNASELTVASLILTGRGNYRDRRLLVVPDAVRFLLAAVGAVAVGVLLLLISIVILRGNPPTLAVINGYIATHLLGYLAVAPLLLPGRLWRSWRRWSGVEFAGVMLAVGGLSVWALLQTGSDGRAFVMLVPVMWSAVRFDAVRATAVSALTSALAAYATAHGRGPLASAADLMQRQILAEVFILVVTASTLGLVLVTRHRTQLATAARDSEHTLRVAIRDALTGMYSIHLEPGRFGEIRDVNTAVCELLRYQPEQLVGRHCGMLGARGDAEQLTLLQSHLERFARREISTLREECMLFTSDGDERWVELSLSAVDSVGEARFVLVHVHDLTDREDAKRSLEQMALHDPLTGLANRTLLFRRMGAAMVAARGGGRPAGLFYLDLDGFKQVNDTYGHNAGDTVLIAVARRLAGAVRPDATVARLGGDEFAVLSPIDGDAGDLPAIADRMRRLLREPIGIGAGVTVTIDVSIGVGTTAAADTADDLVRAADQAMYAVKEIHRSAR